MSTIVATNIEDLDTGDTVSVSNLITINDQRGNRGFSQAKFSTVSLTVGVGSCWDSTDSYYFDVGLITKNFNIIWAVGTVVGGLDTAGPLPSNDVVHLYAMFRDSDGVGDIIGSLSSNWAGVTKPTGYTYGRHIGAWSTNATPEFYSFNERSGDYSYPSTIQMFSATGAAQTAGIYHLFNATALPPQAIGRGIVYATSSSAWSYCYTGVKSSGAVGDGPGAAIQNGAALSTFGGGGTSGVWQEPSDNTSQMCYMIAHNATGGAADCAIYVYLTGYHYPDRFAEV
tara:strand:+ start:1446 stop:2297 length:852 start_codon:yes stop_codon:yes gene_type:complete